MCAEFWVLGSFKEAGGGGAEGPVDVTEPSQKIFLVVTSMTK